MYELRFWYLYGKTHMSSRKTKAVRLRFHALDMRTFMILVSVIQVAHVSMSIR